MSESVQVQSVLYRNGPAEIWRFARGLFATVRAAQLSGLISTAEIRIGDCSETPAIHGPLADGQLADLFEPLEGVSFSHEFFGENRFFGGGHNALAAGATADYLLIVNPDTYASPEMLTALLSAMSDPKVGIAEARQIPIEHPKAFDLATGDTSWASGCCLLMRRWVFAELGGFDEEFFPLYCEDVDLSWRAKLSGLKVKFVHDAAIFHDKHLAENGHVGASDAEQYYSAFSRLMLTRRYGRSDIETDTTDSIKSHGNRHQREALRDFERRVSRGEVPVPLAGAETVAQFTRGEYASHRF